MYCVCVSCCALLACHFHHSDDVGLPLLISAIHLFHYASVHGPPSLCWTSNVDPVGKENEPLQVSLPLMYLSLACFRASQFIISITFIGSLFIYGNRALIGLLNISVAGLGNPVPNGIVLIYNKTRLMSS